MRALISQVFIMTLIANSDCLTSQKTCDKEATVCEFYLDVSFWLPMRRNYAEKVYINDSDGRLYVHGDESYNPVDPDNVVLADGSPKERALTLFNRTMPGPTLIAYVNQEVKVHVKNHMLSDGITVHFHGIEMRGTPWMDGAAFVTQCPILPGQTFTYRFTPNRKGTYFYHSHTGAQMNMGLVGAFIVKERRMDEFEEHVMVIQDYNNFQSSDELFAGTALLGFISTEGEPSRSIQITSSLINGKGRIFDHQGKQLTNTPLTVFPVQQGNTYRFRVIGGGYVLQHKVSVDNHKLKLVAADGNDIDPIIAESFILHAGERFDFVIEADQTVNNYWIRAETLQRNTHNTGFAILRYDGAEMVDPKSSVQQCSRQNICTVVNCPFETFPNWTCIPTDQMHSTSPAPTLKSRSFKEFFVSVGFARTETNVLMGHVCLGILLNDSFSQIPVAPDGFPECRNFPPPSWLTSGKRETLTNGHGNRTVIRTDGRTFTEEEFWGMFGALLFVVLLQFIISVWCIRRTKASESF